MHQAAEHEDIGFLKAALHHGGNPNLRGGQFGETPLFNTFSYYPIENHKDNRQLLLASGADIDARTVHDPARMSFGGNTPVMKAAIEGKLEVVYELLEAGADYKVRNDDGDDLADLIARTGLHPRHGPVGRVVDWLSDRGVKIPVVLEPLEEMFPDQQAQALAKAAEEGDLRKLEELAAQGIDVNVRGKKNATPLLRALRRGNLKGFTKLLELGADPNILFDGGGAVMHWAAKHEDIGFLRAALEHGGNPNLKAGQFGETPLFNTFGPYSAENRKENRQLLLASGADVDARTVRNPKYMTFGGNTPAMSAAFEQEYDVVYELLEAGTDYRIWNDDGDDLSSLIAKNRYDIEALSDLITWDKAVPAAPAAPKQKNLQKVIDWLWQRGVKVPAILKPLEAMFPDQQAQALAKAAGKGNLLKLEELASQGVDVNARGWQNATPLLWALHKSNLRGFRKLLELGADPNILFDDGGAVMHWAARLEDAAFLQAALEHGGNPNLKAGPFGETPLFNAYSGPHSDLRYIDYKIQHIQLLLASGADIDARTVHNPARMSTGGNTPVMSAVLKSEYRAAYDLLKAGADYTIKNDDGHDLSDLMAQKAHIGVFWQWEVSKVIDWLSDRGVEIPE